MSWLYWLKLLLLVLWWIFGFCGRSIKIVIHGFCSGFSDFCSINCLALTVSKCLRSYEESPKPETAVIVSLSQQLGLDPYIVRVWFTNRWASNQLLARTQVQHQNGRRQKDKRIASGGSASAGAAYRNPSSDGHPPSSSTAAATNLTDGPAAPAGTTPIKVINYKTWSNHVPTNKENYLLSLLVPLLILPNCSRRLEEV